FEHAHEQYRHGDLADAAETVAGVIKQYPRNATARMFHVEILFALRRYDEALAATDDVAAMYPDSYNVQIFAAVLYRNIWHATGDMQAKAGAIQYYRRARRLFIGLKTPLDEFLQQR
ncbi:MAG: hypothetical protein D6800_07440, partial [Candidatus Zixiibacteriota bacterium]